MSLSNNDLLRAWLTNNLSSGVVAGTSDPTAGTDVLAETVQTYASLLGNNASAGAAIVTIAAGSLPAGLYRVEVTDILTAATTPVLFNNVELRVGGVSRRRIFHVNAIASAAAPVSTPQVTYVRLNGSTNLSVNFVANFGAGETQTHDVILAATRVNS